MFLLRNAKMIVDILIIAALFVLTKSPKANFLVHHYFPSRCGGRRERNLFFIYVMKCILIYNMSEKTVSVTPSVLLYPHKGGGTAGFL